SSGSEVRRLQQQLAEAGFDPGGVDGQFGRNTQSAVLQFQRARGLQIDGVVGSQTLDALAGISSFDGGSTTPGSQTTATTQGYAHQWKQFREVSPQALAATLPSQARHLAGDFIAAARRNNIDPLLLVAISRHETGNWTSSAFRNKNNAMGISNANGPRTFSSASQSIDIMARELAKPNGYYRNAGTLRALWGVYAPGPATGQPLQRNDPNNLNRHWGPNILRNLRELESQLGIR
ncbi:MAG: peptidoglycan-binding protein, partial [Myxococcaceae bacterium]|nr:peptidoglycan-binding protein [Myxococcaceae bacterium]